MRKSSLIVPILLIVIVSLGCAVSGMLENKDLLEQENFKEALEAFKAELGSDAQIKKITVNSETVVVSVEDESNSRTNTQYIYRRGWISKSRGADSTYGRFKISDVDTSKLKGIKSDAIERAGPYKWIINEVSIEVISDWREEELVSAQDRDSDTLGWIVTTKVGQDSAAILFAKDGKFLRSNLKETTRSRYASFHENEDDLKMAADRINSAFGGSPKIMNLSIRENIIYVDAQDPKKKDEVNQYRYEVNRVTKFREMQDSEIRRERESNAVTYDELFFDIDEIAFAEVPRMIKEAKEKLGFEDGQVSSFSVYRVGKLFGDKNQIRIAVTVVSDRKKGKVTFDSKGKLLKAKIE